MPFKSNTIPANSNPAYQFNPRYHEYTYTLAPGDVLPINVDSDFVNCISADYDFKVSFNDGPESNFRRGMKYTPGQTVRRTTIRNSGTVSNSITLGLGLGDIVDARLSVPQELLSASIVPDTGKHDGKTIVSTGAAIRDYWLLAPANPNRREIMVENISSETFYLKFNVASADTGFALIAGERWISEYAGTLYGAHDFVGSKNLRVHEVGFNLLNIGGGI